MTGKDKETLWKNWMLEGFTWWLDDAIKLLFGHDPRISEEQLALEGNDVIVRAGVTARKAISTGQLTPINERTRPDNAKNYLVERDEFVKWAKSEFPADGGELHDVWKQYKRSRPKNGKLTRLDKNKAEWQEEVDAIYVREFEKTGKVPTHTFVCREAANSSTGSEGTIRRHTRRRSGSWLGEQITKRKKSQN